MEVLAHGIDLVECERLAAALARHGNRFLDRVFTAAEQAYAGRHRRRVERLAGRFAVKEAVFKVLGTGWRGRMAWTDIETVNDPLGKPQVTLRGAVAERAAALGIARIEVSITHARGLAVASAIGLGQARPGIRP